MVDAAAADAVPSPLKGLGLEIETDRQPGGGEHYVVRGDTYHHKETLKAHGGRWSKSRRAWVFASLDALQRLEEAVSGKGEKSSSAKPGLAEAASPFHQPGEIRSTPAAPGMTAASNQRHFEGHRGRLRQRFLESDGEGMPDYELLELLLFSSVRYVDVKPLAKHLLSEIGSLGGLLALEKRELEEVMLQDDPGLLRNPGTARDHLQRMGVDAKYARCVRDGVDFTITSFKAMQRLLQRVLKEDLRARPVISSWQALLDYLKLALGHEPIEQFRVLFLDKKNILITDQVQQRGTVDHTPLYPREIAKRALELGASAVIMVHNHPSGDPTPSRADIEMTKQVAAALAPIRIALHDHLIIGQTRHTSFKSEGLL